jgi:hypothetical protein
VKQVKLSGKKRENLKEKPNALEIELRKNITNLYRGTHEFRW